ncbi:MAG: beta-N-acetylhexosaminidase [Candidatus Nitricoxidivorans perseverans]|uniref:Beta-hexosaminidase n=1 Tax=Candidatus Nitricoxidivorans perseverans TaxID=2975601 RepID=A0AA49FM58_9PROT|nr:MAG: beta-N-acetylhexosaminidase [Candidatus Nitricoxidivorans perseverans]
MNLGPLMIDIEGQSLGELDRERLAHAMVGGVILFSRNYESPEQLSALCANIHALRPLPIAVDHEGGRVQRFREGFTRLPAMRRLGEWWDQTPRSAIECARSVGFLLASELRSMGVDLSFAPVLDLDWGRSGVIGDRAFHGKSQAVAELAGGLIAGMREAGMACCGKHFPGHGWAEADSHVAIPVDERSLADLAADLAPYRELKLDAVMPAHVIYPRVDSRPAGFSPVWLGKLRDEFGFDGVIFSDDLSMEGASVAGGIVERAQAAWDAGCDMLLVCNAPDSVGELLERWRPSPDPARSERVARLLPTKEAIPPQDLEKQVAWQAGRAVVRRLAGFMPAPRTA